MTAGEKASARNIGIVLLAAGSSSRLGTPKQLLLYRGQSLLQHSLHAALASGAGQVVVVLGAHADTIQKEITTHTAHVAINAEWEEGVASSIRQGITSLVALHPSIEAAVLMVGDQPHVHASLLEDLMAAHHRSGKPIVACNYAGTFGPPVLFHKTLFPELLQLRGDVGARSVIRHHANEVETVAFPEGNIDIDTEADYRQLG